MFLLLALPLFIFLPSPWNVFGGFAALVLFCFEVGYWQRRMRHQEVQTGVGTLVGATGEVSEPLAPVGQIRVRGEVWEAHSSSELSPGTRVRVIAVNGLTLEVEPVDRTVTNVRPAP
jgi:membrane protein implicated in regulation of membrane protease activity